MMIGGGEGGEERGARSWAGTRTTRRCRRCPCRTASSGCRKRCAMAVRPTTSARCGSSSPKRSAPARRSSPTSISRCAATGRSTRSCALRRPDSGRNLFCKPKPVQAVQEKIQPLRSAQMLNFTEHRPRAFWYRQDSHSPTGVVSRYFFSVISLAASAARVKSKIEALETSPFRPAVTPNMAI